MKMIKYIELKRQQQQQQQCIDTLDLLMIEKEDEKEVGKEGKKRKSNDAATQRGRDRWHRKKGRGEEDIKSDK